MHMKWRNHIRMFYDHWRKWEFEGIETQRHSDSD